MNSNFISKTKPTVWAGCSFRMLAALLSYGLLWVYLAKTTVVTKQL